MPTRALTLMAMACVAGCSGSPPPPDLSRASTIERYDISIPAFGGELLGRDDGEWGGMLAFRDASGAVTHLVEKNVLGLHRMPYGYVAVTGLSHMRVNEGELLLITRRSPEKIRVDLLRALPHAAHGSRQRADGAVEIVLFAGRLEKGRWVSECVLLGIERSLKSIACPVDLRLKY